MRHFALIGAFVFITAVGLGCMDTSQGTVPPGAECGDLSAAKTHGRALVAGHASHADDVRLCDLEVVSKHREEDSEGRESESDDKPETSSEHAPCDATTDIDRDWFDDSTESDADGDGI